MAGAGYKLFNTGDVLTAAQVNTYLNEQTVMVFASSAARTSALSGVLAEGMVSYLQDTNAVEVYNGSAWVGVGNVGDITEVQAGVGISVASGTGPIPVITNSSTDLITTAGDLLYGTAADTVARLGIGTAGQVLKVNSGATAPEWGAAAGGGGGMTLLNSGGTSLSGSATTVSFTSTGYVNLQIQVLGVKFAADANGYTVRINGDTAANYSTLRSNIYDTAPSFDPNSTVGATSISIRSPLGSSSDYYKLGQMVMEIYQPNDTSQHFFNWSCVGSNTTLTNPWYMFNSLGIYDASAAISSLVFTTVGSTFTAGTVYVYGVK